MLLLPFGLEPQWVGRADLQSGSLYYGQHLEGLPDKVVAVRLHEETIAYFSSRTPYLVDKVQWIKWDGEDWPVLFADDFIADTFFWLSGWQEYTQPQRDQHGRFLYRHSLQAYLGTATRPVVEVHRARLADRLIEAGILTQQRTWGEASWTLCPTHDIDYLQKWRKGMVYREVVLYFLRNLRQVSASERIRRLLAFFRDWIKPGDVYRLAFDRMHKEVVQREGTATYFLKTGAHGKNDVAYSLKDRFLLHKVAILEQDGFEVGLHPSYFAHTHASYLQEEYDQLSQLMGRQPGSIRQHYLRYEVPSTPRMQANSGFEIDSSLGFADHDGFRHSTCLPFQVYDPVGDHPLDLWAMPLVIMESALFNRRSLSLEEACSTTDEVLQTCKRFGGAAVMLWHNVLWDEMDHPGWGAHFIHSLDEATSQGARIASLHEAFHAWLGSKEK